MGDNAESKRQARAGSLSAPVEGLSERAIRKQLRSDAMQHPTTILALGVAVVSLIYLLLVSPLLGGSLGALIVLICSAVMAAGSFFWRYSIRYTEAYAERVQELTNIQDHERSEIEQVELKELRNAVLSAFAALDSAEGRKAVEELAHEYEQLQAVAGREKVTDPLSIAHVSALAQETYRQGLGVLRHAFELMRAIDLSDRNRLEAEIPDLEKEIESLKRKEDEEALLKIREDTLASHKGRLDLMKEHQLHVEKLLYQSTSCEASLHRTRIELAALKAESAEVSVRAVTETLQQTIEQAKAVQEELRRLGF